MIGLIESTGRCSGGREARPSIRERGLIRAAEGLIGPLNASAVFSQIPELEEGCDGILLAAPSGELVQHEAAAGEPSGAANARQRLRLPAPVVRLVRRQWTRRPEADAIFLKLGGRILLARAQARDVDPPQILITLLDVTRARARAERQELVKRNKALASERRALARELHDVVAQRLATLIVHFECDLRDGVIEHERITAYRNELRGILAAVRSVHQELRWTPADSRTLVDGIRQYAIPRLEQAQCRARVVTRRWPKTLSPDHAFHVLRFVQEAVANVARHAQASRAVIRMEGEPRCAMVSITDNGVGFDVEGRSASTSDAGLVGMRERAELMGGTLNLVSTPGLGTTVGLVVPIRG